MRLGLAFLGVSLSTGCVAPPEDARQRLEALEAEGREMDALLDTVETRMLGNQSTLLLWQELGRRHQQVSALACQNADTHLQAMLKHSLQQKEKARNLKRRVAAVDAAVLMSGKAPRRGSN
ncbi:hypothetical protein P2318_01995 [Myxococcaceae bacterium GXIMD 01537]